jgi:hypothetical protein
MGERKLQPGAKPVYKPDPLANRVAINAHYHLEEPSFANILEFLEDNTETFRVSPDQRPRLAAQARQIIRNGGT